jgi:iron complex outermembrane receptor protein
MTHERLARERFHFKRKKTAHGVLLACLSMAGGWTAMTAHAQTAAAPAAPAAAASAAAAQNLDKVVVTARKREELAVEVPISLLTYSEKELHDAGITDIESLSKSAGFQLQQSTNGSTIPSGRTLGTISFRGLQPSTALPRDNSGSVFIDGIFISGGVSTVNMADVARVEVLKGPQNTYFGRNTFGGAVNLVTKNPPTTFGGQVNASVTGRGSTDADGTIGGPLTDTIRGSVTVFNHIKEAQYHATDGGDLGAEKTTGIAGGLLFTPNDKLWVRVRGHYQRDDDSAAQIGYLRGDVYGTCNGQTYGGKTAAGVPITYSPTVGYFCGTVPSSGQVGLGNVLNANTAIPAAVVNGFVNNTLNAPFMSDTPNLNHSGMRRDASHYSVQGSYELPMAATLGFSLGYNQAASRSIWDLDRSVLVNFFNLLNIATDDLTGDVRVTSDPTKPLRGLLGVSYFKSKFQLSQVDWNAAFGAPGPTNNTSNYDNERSNVPAVYGSVDYDITKMLTVTGEARYQRDKATTFASVSGTEYSQSFSNVLPRGIVQFKPMADTNIYASWSKGVQPTSFNSGYVNATPAQRTYINSISPNGAIFTPQPSIRNLEAGIKQVLMNGRLEYALSAYQLDWSNQVTLSAVFNSPACIAAGTSNTAACPLGPSGSSILLPNNARIRGIEFSTLAYATPNWNVGLNLDFKDAKWKTYYNSFESAFAGGAARFDGNSLTRVPKINVALNSTYTAPLTGSWAWFARGDLFYNGKSYADNENIAQIAAYTRVNLRAGVQNKNTTIEVFSTNVFDDKHWDFAYKLTDLAFSPLASFSRQGVGVYAPDRREIGVRIRQSF